MAAAARTFPITRTDRVFNAVVAGLSRFGISLLGSRVLAVRGRTTGEIRTVPVNLLTVDGQPYLVAPRGQVQWVRNLRVAGEGELRIGRRAEVFDAEELSDEEKVPVLREYLRKWAWEVGRFFDGLDAASDDAALRAAAPDFPAFRVRCR
ncbi:MAG: nitroreductase/quinone reductase family protein [Pseudonocardia sp.]|nr:nitroreductase/quinone reductase family protein [Pseudonocardia sp.]